MLTDDLSELARDGIARLRESWGWLGELVEPGRETRSLAPILTDAQTERMAGVIRAERAERAGRKAAGLGPLTDRRAEVGSGALAPSAASARIAVIDAAVAVRRLVLDAARCAAEFQDASYVGGAAGDAAVPDALAYLDGGPPCWIASTTGVIGRRMCRGAVDVLGLSALAEMVRLVDRADKVARAAAGVAGEESMPFPHCCPACGRRSLQWSMPGLYRARWSVACIRPLCRCTGPGCGCRQAVKYEGRRHAWAYGELDGTWGLWRAIAAAYRAAPRLRSGAAGHGGWPEKK